MYFILSKFRFYLWEFCLFTFSANFTIRVRLLRGVFSVFVSNRHLTEFGKEPSADTRVVRTLLGSVFWGESRVS